MEQMEFELVINIELWNYELLSMEMKYEKQGDHINPLMVFPRGSRIIVL